MIKKLRRRRKEYEVLRAQKAEGGRPSDLNQHGLSMPSAVPPGASDAPDNLARPARLDAIVTGSLPPAEELFIESWRALQRSVGATPFRRLDQTALRPGLLWERLQWAIDEFVSIAERRSLSEAVSAVTPTSNKRLVRRWRPAHYGSSVP